MVRTSNFKLSNLCKDFTPVSTITVVIVAIAFHLHLRQDIVDEAVLDEVEVDQLVLQLDDPPDGRVQQLSQQQPFDDGGDDGDDDGDPPVI